MDRFVSILIVAALVGLFNGVAMLKTAWEIQARGLRGPWSPFGSSMFGSFANMLFASLLGLAMFLGLPLVPLEVLDLLPLRGTELRWFFGTYLVSIGAGKPARYAFWKWRLRALAA